MQWQLTGTGTISATTGTTITYTPPSTGSADQFNTPVSLTATATGGTGSVTLTAQPFEWQYTAYDSSNASLAGMYSSPALASDGTIYYIDLADNLNALTDAGVFKWQVNVGTPMLGNGIVASPVVGSDGTIFTSSLQDGHVFAVNPDGTVKWSVALAIDVQDPVLGADGTVYIGANDQIVALDAATGATKFAFNPAATPDNVLIEAVSSSGMIYVSQGGILMAINSAGLIQWSVVLGNPKNLAIGADGTLYFEVATGIEAMSSAGVVLWTYAVTGEPIGGATVGADGTIYFGTSNITTGTLFALNPAGTLKWSQSLSLPADSAPLLGADGTIYIASAINTNPPGNAFINAFDSAGTLRWTAGTTNGYLAPLSPTLEVDGKLIVPGVNYITAYQVNTTLAASSWPKFKGSLTNSGLQ